MGPVDQPERTLTDDNLREAIGVNDRGEVAGRSLTAGDSAVHAFFYRDGTIIDLTRLVSDLFQVEDFSVQGIGTEWIIGYGYRDGERQIFHPIGLRDPARSAVPDIGCRFEKMLPATYRTSGGTGFRRIGVSIVGPC